MVADRTAASYSPAFARCPSQRQIDAKLRFGTPLVPAIDWNTRSPDALPDQPALVVPWSVSSPASAPQVRVMIPSVIRSSAPMTWERRSPGFDADSGVAAPQQEASRIVR